MACADGVNLPRIMPCLFYSTDADAKATREATEKEIRQQEYDEVSMRKR